MFHENRLLTDDSREISYLNFSEIRKDVTKFVVCCSRDWRFKGLDHNRGPGTKSCFRGWYPGSGVVLDCIDS